MMLHEKQSWNITYDETLLELLPTETETADETTRRLGSLETQLVQKIKTIPALPLFRFRYFRIGGGNRALSLKISDFSAFPTSSRIYLI